MDSFGESIWNIGYITMYIPPIKNEKECTFLPSRTWSYFNYICSYCNI